MDPKTGLFHEDRDLELLPLEWPRFTVGEELEVKGVTFVVQRINRSNIVLRPKPANNKVTVQELMRMLTMQREGQRHGA